MDLEVQVVHSAADSISLPTWSKLLFGGGKRGEGGGAFQSVKLLMKTKEDISRGQGNAPRKILKVDRD